MTTRIGQGTTVGPHHNICYSQFGEDQVIDHFFRHVCPVDDGFYVDAGCHHTENYSNTRMLYDKGWRGVCVDADSRLASMYEMRRPRDTFVPVGLGPETATATFFEFENPAANTFDPAARDAYLAKGWRMVRSQELPIRPLGQIVAERAPDRVDFLNVDVEGLDAVVLRSFDFERYRPMLVCVETNCRDLARLASTEIATFLTERGYYAYSHCVISTLFALRRTSP
jgi:FkbM family methyltransferase